MQQPDIGIIMEQEMEVIQKMEMLCQKLMAGMGVQVTNGLDIVVEMQGGMDLKGLV